MSWKSSNEPVATAVKVTRVCKDGTSSTPGNSAMGGAPFRVIEVSGGAGPLSLMIPLDSWPSSVMAGGSNSKASIWGGTSGDLASVTFIGSSFERFVRREFPYPGKAQIMPFPTRVGIRSLGNRARRTSENPLPHTPLNKAGMALPSLRVLALADRVVGRRPNTSSAKERIDGFQDLQEHLGRGLRPLRSDQRFRGRREARGTPA